MAISTINAITSQLKSGARPNLFNVDVVAPTGATTTTLPTNASLLCKAGQAPAYTIGMIEVPFRGRRIKLPGDRTFAEWTATFIVDQGYKVRKYFEEWSNFVKARDFTSGTLRTVAGDNVGYYGSIDVIQLSDDQKKVRTYKLKDVFPTDVAQIDVSYDTTDAIMEFSVTFQYHYFTVA